MTIRFNPRWLLVSALLFSLQFCRAQVDVPPTISFDLGSNAPDTQLWDLSGAYRLDLLVEERDGAIQTPMRLSFILNQDGKGKLSSPTNDNTEEMDFGDNSLLTVYPRVTGKVTGSGGTARVHFSIHVTGYGMLAGQTINSFSAMLTVPVGGDEIKQIFQSLSGLEHQRPDGILHANASGHECHVEFVVATGRPEKINRHRSHHHAEPGPGLGFVRHVQKQHLQNQSQRRERRAECSQRRRFLRHHPVDSHL
jgi:hypothetical protein